MPAIGKSSLHAKPLDLGSGDHMPVPQGAFAYFHFLFATIFSWGLIKDLEPFTACGWLFLPSVCVYVCAHACMCVCV